MRRCKAQMRDRSPGLVAVPPLQPPRGLELIKSSAKFYANGAGTRKPTIQLSCPVPAAPNKPKTIKTFSAPIGKVSGRTVAMMCLLLLVLPGLGLAVIVWCGIRMADAGAPQVAVGEGFGAIGKFSRYAANEVGLCSTDCFDGYHHSQGEDGAH